MSWIINTFAVIGLLITCFIWIPLLIIFGAFVWSIIYALCWPIVSVVVAVIIGWAVHHG